jgi:hypothetical protein
MGSGFGGPRFSPIRVPLTKEVVAKYQDEEAKMAYSPLPVVCLTGLAAGIGLWAVPIAWLVLNFLLGIMSGARGARFGLHLLPLLASPTFQFWMAFTGAMGVAAALARRWSARRRRYWYVNVGESGPIRLGLDDVVSLVAGTALLWWGLNRTGAGQLFYWLCFLAPIPGFLLHALWQGLHSPLIRWAGKIPPAGDDR